MICYLSNHDGQLLASRCYRKKIGLEGIPVNFTDDIAQAGTNSKTVTALMEKHGVPLTPDNYAVWYAYVTERDLDLKKALDTLIDDNQSFTPDKNGEIYQQFLDTSSSGAAVQKTSDQIQASVDQVTEIITKASDGAAKYGNVLETQAGGLSDSTSAEEMKVFV